MRATMKLLSTAAAVAAMATLGAGAGLAADSQSAEIEITGEQDETCTLGTFSDSGQTNTSFAANTVTIDDPGGDDALLDAFAITLTAAAMCNFSSHDVGLESQNDGLTGPGAVPGFSHIIDYTATATFGVAPSITTDQGSSPGRSDSDTNADPTVGDLVVTIVNVTTGGAPLIAGTYEDILTVEIGNI